MSHINLMNVDRDDRAFVMQRLSPFSADIQRILLNAYLSLDTKFTRNTYLRETTERLAARLSVPLSKLELDVSEDDLCAKGKHLATSVLTLRRQYNKDTRALSDVRCFVRVL